MRSDNWSNIGAMKQTSKETDDTIELNQAQHYVPSHSAVQFMIISGVEGCLHFLRELSIKLDLWL